MMETSLDRRRFLHALWLISLAGSAGCSSLGRKTVASPATLAAAGAKGLVYLCIAKDKDSSVLRIMNWDDGSFTDHSIPLGYPHSIVQDIRNPRTLYSFESFGSLAKFDLDAGSISKVDHLNKTSMFDGHGVLSRSGSRLICTEFDQVHATIVTIRDAMSLERLSVAPSECHQSHQVVALPGTSIVACANLTSGHGSAGAITFFDYETNRVLKRVEFDHPVIHLTAISGSEVLGVSRPTTFDPATPFAVSTSKTSMQNLKSILSNTLEAGGPVVYARLDGAKKTFWDPSRASLFNGSFGIAAIPSSKSFLSTHYQSGRVLLWRDGVIDHVFEAPGAMNVVTSADGSEFMALGNEEIQLFSLENRKKIKTIAYDKPILLIGNFRGSYG